ncbi:MAG: YraN family protein [Lachnospiraceae bacterium]|nr:YraN family protein [Lachnospiraceae bacterium]
MPIRQENLRAEGSKGESVAADFLEAKGCRILDRNFHSRYGEIDLIYLDNSTLCFGEVKYRKSDRKGYPAEAVTRKKQGTISRVSDYYRMKNGLGEDLRYRFDVIGIDGNGVEWLKNAFEYIPPK